MQYLNSFPAASQVPTALTEPPPSGSQRRSAELVRLCLPRNPLGSPGAFPDALPLTLQLLDLSSCGLRAVPACVGALPRLTTLLLRGNAGLGPATASGGAGDDASVSSHEGLAALAVPTLETLDLSECGLTRLPLAVLGLSRLRSLLLTDNDLASVCPHVATLPLLATLGIDGNPQRTVRTAVLTKGSAAVLAYLRTRIPEGEATRYAQPLQSLFARAPASGAPESPPPPSASSARGLRDAGVVGAGMPALPLSARDADRAPPGPPPDTAREAELTHRAATAPLGMARAQSSGGLLAASASGRRQQMQPGEEEADHSSRTALGRGGRGSSGAAAAAARSGSGGGGPPWATEDNSASAPPARGLSRAGSAVGGGGGGPVWEPTAPTAAPAVAQPVHGATAPGGGKQAELAAVLARIEELNGDVQRGGMSSSLLAAVRRQLIVLRSNETRLRAEVLASGGPGGLG